MGQRIPVKARAAVIGGGAFGTALTLVLSQTCAEVRMWAREPEVVDGVNLRHENELFLKGIPLPKNVSATSDLAEALAGAELVVAAVPSQFSRSVMQKATPYLPKVPIVSISKGIETGTLLLPTQILEECLPLEFHPFLAALSGPSFAKEIALGAPTLVTIAANREEVAQECQAAFTGKTFRSYSSTDILGIQLGGALKNVIAIAAGISDGLGLGHNARAALITRGLAEISRLAVHMGANPMTLAGLSGMGDLVLTCTGELSRNRTVGFELGKGRSLQEILAGSKQVAEGVKTAESATALAKKNGVEMPICEEVCGILFEGKSPRVAVTELMTRERKAEI